jgi:hypothetical protein
MHFEIASKQRIGNEIATRAEAEIYFRSEDSNGIEDSLINGLVTLARETMEKAINRSLVSHEVVCYASDWKGFLPYGPIDPESIDSDNMITVQGNSYPYVIVGEDQTQITYETECYIGEGGFPSEKNLLLLFWNWQLISMSVAIMKGLQSLRN